MYVRTDEVMIGPGPGSRSRSVEQAEASGQLSSTAGPQSAPARSPDAPADPAQLSGNRGSDPEEVLRSSAWQAQQAMGSSYDRADQGGASFIQHAPGMAGKLAEKVAGAAHIAAQAALGAASAMSDTVKAATGVAVGGSQGPRDAADQGGAAMMGQDASSNIEPGNRDASPVSDRCAPRDHQAVSDNSSYTTGLQDKADGREKEVYQQAADRLMDIEGLPRKDTTGDRA
eukprot:gene4922-5165_t